MIAGHLLLFSHSEECNIFLHNAWTRQRGLNHTTKTNSLVIDGAASYLCALDISLPHIYNTILGQAETQPDGGWQGQETKALTLSREKMNRPQVFSTCPTGATVLQRGDVVLTLCAKTTIESRNQYVLEPIPHRGTRDYDNHSRW